MIFVQKSLVFWSKISIEFFNIRGQSQSHVTTDDQSVSLLVSRPIWVS
jgi:hypothetical protein